jgi:myo-inositol-1-phosphate synthase
MFAPSDLRFPLSPYQSDNAAISPSTIFAVASILEGCSYINGSPQNTFVPGVVQLAEQRDVFIAGDDFKSGERQKTRRFLSFILHPWKEMRRFFACGFTRCCYQCFSFAAQARRK